MRPRPVVPVSSGNWALGAIALWLWRRPVYLVTLSLMVVLALALLIDPAYTAYVLLALVGIVFAHNVRRRRAR